MSVVLSYDQRDGIKFPVFCFRYHKSNGWCLHVRTRDRWRYDVWIFLDVEERGLYFMTTEKSVGYFYSDFDIFMGDFHRIIHKGYLVDAVGRDVLLDRCESSVFDYEIAGVDHKHYGDYGVVYE